ncbi:hypothetical protein ARAM_005767 [Aspergillus rambellii]|uniref:SNF2 family helicase/ATPase n=1 Tax=Aspergillus rambellii TaxID=308745 RepID=A0A0F8WZB4_9EURO|nr:hypothetical protein ARAM_005767 [Aspergillus rambellii]
MQPNIGDPLDWTVDEVVSFLCHNPQTPWSQSNSRVPRPDPVSFEASLRENLINGEVLLQDVDKNALRDDLGLKALGHRSCIMMAIRFLQQRSLKFQHSISHSSRSGQTASPRIQSPSPMSSFAQDALPNSSKTITPAATPATPPFGKTSGVGVPASTPGLNASAVENINGEPSVLQGDLPTLHQRELSQNAVPSPIRPKEHVIVDANGRKRRRLNLNTPVETQGQDLIPAPPNDRFQAQDWYMGPEALTLSQLSCFPDVAGDNESFTLLSPKIPNAQRSFVNKFMSHFWRQSPIKLPSREGSSQWAVFPYKSSLVNPNDSNCFTLSTTKDGIKKGSREKLNEWPQLKNLRSFDDKSHSPNEPLNPSDPFSYLLQKYPVQEDLEDVHPLYGDSGSEGEFDEETWREIEDERTGLQLTKHSKLRPMEIDSIMQDCISEYEHKWQQISQPREEYKAQKLWITARNANRTNQELKAVTKDIGLLETRLRKLQEAIRKSEFLTGAELRTQCQSLEYTVCNIQKQRWRASVLEQESCPPKVPAPPRPSYYREQPKKEEDSLESESDIVSNSSLGDFIDDTQIPHTLLSQSPSENPSSSDGDDDVISVSGIRRIARPLRKGRFLAARSSSSSPVRELSSVIDLTMESPEPDELTIETPPLNPVQLSTPHSSSRIISKRSRSISPAPSLGPSANEVLVESQIRSTSVLPDIDDTDGILSLEWDLLEKYQDRTILLAKLIASLPDKERRSLRKSICGTPMADLRRQTKRALDALLNGEDNIPEFGHDASQLAMRTASLYISWVNCVRLGQGGIKKRYVEKTRKEKRFKQFYAELRKRLEHSKTPQSETVSKGSLHDSGPENTPHKKRKREVKENQAVKMTQEGAQRRVALQDEQRRKLEKKLESMGVRNDNPNHQPVSFKDPVIYLDSHIGLRVKPHQLNGIQFMWRELVEDKSQQGCLLAHTMGLGKTMQVTIAAAAASDDPKVKQQVPETFRRPQTLILCPSSLIENWNDEFLMLDQVSSWYKEGGVLLISYDIFRAWIFNKETSRRPKPLSETEHKNVQKWLLEGPSIIIADEAHKMKNPSSAVTGAAMQFRSKSRVALTGSPLANNLTEYYTMVNWIAQGYLGTPTEFKAHYIEPIEEGLYADSTYGERRKSLMRLQILKEILEPKINRADISVLEGSLPPKVEFVITVPLSKLQKAAYNSYVQFVLQGREDEVGNARILSWLAILGLCCNHPSCFREKLRSRVGKPTRKLDDSDPAPGDEPITQAGLPDISRLLSEQELIYRDIHDMMAVELSPRAEILNMIIDESIKAGDKVLVFSQSLPTLDYIEHLLIASNRGYSRLDGHTPISTRQQATKNFNSGDEEQVYLISTQAGGLGLNIPGANRVIIFDFSFNPVWEEQAVGRAYRLGQQKPVFVYRFVAGGTFEEIIHQKAVFKTQLAVRVVDKKNPIRFASKKLGDYLFPAKPVKQEDVSSFMEKDPFVLDKILLVDANREERLIRRITLTQTFHKDDNDKLTEEEKRDVQKELDDERLKRTDPVAYTAKLRERQKQEQVYTPTPQFSTQTFQQMHHPAFPPSAQNTGPRAFAPDTSILQVAVPGHSPVIPSPPLAAVPRPQFHASPVSKHAQPQQLPDPQAPATQPIQQLANNTPVSTTKDTTPRTPAPQKHTPSKPTQGEPGGGCKSQ